MGDRRPHPFFIPFSLLATNLVPNAVGVDGMQTFCKVHDATWPRPYTLNACAGGIPLALNEHSTSVKMFSSPLLGAGGRKTFSSGATVPC